MGNCCSPSESKYSAGDENNAGKDRASTSGGAAKKPNENGNVTKKKLPDFGLPEEFETIKVLGKGGEGETWLFKDKNNGSLVAIKLIKRPIPKPAIAVIKREIKIQGDLGEGHLNIVHANEVILTKSYLGLAMEYVPGGNMVSYVTKRRETRSQRGGLCIDEDEARYYFKQLISAVEYCHAHQVAHRDLKLDNTLLDGHNPPWLKLCDFGFAKHWQGASANMDTMRIGTPEYMGPELISSRSGYDGKKVDVWAAGVLLYVMLVGMFPFETAEDDGHNNTAGLYDIWLQQVKTNWRDLPNNNKAAPKLTMEVKDLLDKMFDVKQDSRINLDAIRSHPWYNKPLPERYAASLAELEAAQEEVNIRMSQLTSSTTERDKAMEVLLDSAATSNRNTQEVTRIGLARGARIAGIGMSPVKEE